MTPLFPIIGFNHLVFRFLTPDQRMALHGGTSMLYLSTMVLMPNAFYYAPILLPFAVGNGVTAGALYVVAETACGGPEALAAKKAFGWIPLAGPLLGVVTALLVPVIYPFCWDVFFPGLPFDSWLKGKLYAWCYGLGPGTSCLVATGLASGFLIDLFLRPVVLGVPGWPWHQLAGVVLAAATLCLGALYSTSFRTDVLHVKDVDLSQIQTGGFLEWLFPTKVSCYVRGVDELCWIPALDPATGKLCSERRSAVADVNGRCSLSEHQALESSQVVGLQAFEDAAKLRRKAQDKHVRVFTSQRAAYFDGCGQEPLDRASVARLGEELPIGEVIMTDAVVVLLAGSPSALSKLSLRALLPSFRESGLVRRLGGGINPLKRPWTADLEGGTSEGVRAWLVELSLRSAQLRELLRLEAGAPAGPWRRDALESELTAAGIDIARARAALRKVSWTPPGEKRLRDADWAAMRRSQRRERNETAGRAVVAGAVVAAVLLGVWHGSGSGA